MELKRAERKIEAHQEGEVIGEITYSNTNNGMWIIDHTYVDPAHRNQQIGEQLVAEIVNWAREANVKLLPLCPFAKKEFEH
ncbi:MAG TPA: N-acetyltransferase, partial [Exiguobacterium sp.]|nr:N-acetyltransferase [Exiguobacterium sp.]